MITTILFDLDGTLLPMEQETFARSYIMGLTAAGQSAGYSPMLLSAAIVSGTAAMVKNDGRITNEEVFWDTLESIYGRNIRQDIHLFDKFYETDFQKIQTVCGFAPEVPPLIRHIRSLGYRCGLATNPIFPAVATKSRIRWAGLSEEDFQLITTYENSRHCKPNPDYYRDVMAALGIAPANCLMVGNDVTEDMIARELGMEVFLLTDCLINRENRDVSPYPRGGFAELRQFIDDLTHNQEERMQREQE